MQFDVNVLCMMPLAYTSLPLPCRTVQSILSCSPGRTVAGSTPSSLNLCRCWWLSVSTPSSLTATWWAPSSRCSVSCRTRMCAPSDTPSRSLVGPNHKAKIWAYDFEGQSYGSSGFCCEAAKLLSSLMGVALSLSVGVENSQKLYGVQRTKTARQRSPQQLERLQKKITEVSCCTVAVHSGGARRVCFIFTWSVVWLLSLKLQEKRAEIESMMDVIFKGVFLKRYRCSVS